MGEDWQDESDDLGFSDELDEEWDAEWEQADRDAVEVLRNALREAIGQPPPGDQLTSAAAAVRTRLREGGHSLDWVIQGAGISDESVPDDDAELLLELAAATISPEEETGLDVEEEAMLVSLEHADWLGAIVTTVRGGIGADASPDALVDGIRNCPEVVSEDIDSDEASDLEATFSIIALPWHLLGLADADGRLTPVGRWILPRALARAWGGDFDAQPEAEDASGSS